VLGAAWAWLAKDVEMSEGVAAGGHEPVGASGSASTAGCA
jgi:hypothetical protein